MCRLCGFSCLWNSLTTSFYLKYQFSEVVKICDNNFVRGWLESLHLVIPFASATVIMNSLTYNSWWTCILEIYLFNESTSWGHIFKNHPHYTIKRKSVRSWSPRTKVTSYVALYAMNFTWLHVSLLINITWFHCLLHRIEQICSLKTLFFKFYNLIYRFGIFLKNIFQAWFILNYQHLT